MHVSSEASALSEAASTPRPRVLLDFTALPANRGGVGRYLEGLLDGLDEEIRDGALSLTVVAQARDAADVARLAPRARVVSLHPAFYRRALRLLWEQVGLPQLARREQADVIHSPHYTYPLLSRRRRVVTLHDATFFSDPGVHSPLKQRFFRAWSKAAWRHADSVITPSRATASELERFLGTPRARVAVALHGVDTTVFHPPTPDDVAALRASLALAPDERWIAFLGTIEPRKNLPNLIRAHRELRKQLGTGAPSLLIAGGRGWDDEAARMLDEAAADPDSGVRELGYLALEQLPALLGGASVVAYPSLGEGFGLPVLEAMATGAVVVTTRRLALPEVGGDAVAYSEPDVDALVECLVTLLQDDAAATRLRAAGLTRAATLTWRASAAVHVETYRAGKVAEHV